MNGSLDDIQDWLELAEQAGWCAALLASQCSVSVRTLERYFHEKMGMHPHAWLSEQRQRLALQLLREGKSVKETAIILGYKHAAHFSRDFKRRWGHPPGAESDSFEI